jgi:undecaprenol kinase
MKVHCVFAALAVICSFVFRITEVEFIFVIFAIALVMIVEAANTAFELLLDFVHGDRFHPDVKLLKDIVAGGVLIAALNAFVVGIVIFIPKIFKVALSICKL